MIKYASILFTLLGFWGSVHAQQDTLLLDLGSNLSPFPWNNLTLPRTGSLPDLYNHQGFSTGISVAVTDEFNGVNQSGTTQPDPALAIAAQASGDSFFGNDSLFGGQVNPSGAIQFDHLDPTEIYTVQIFSSRTASDNRETRYLVQGLTSDTLFLDVASNTDSMVVAQLMPALDSTLTITATSGPNNTNEYGFFYLGVVKLIYDAVPPAGPVTLDLTTPDGGEYWQVGKTAHIVWESENVGQAILSFSADLGQTWQAIDTVFAGAGSYDWMVPNTPTTQALIRMEADTLLDQSTSAFEIGTDTTICTIVVLGSSTAAGSGPSHPDSTWVNRYRKALTGQDTRLEVVNLARGGYTTFHILPTGSATPAGSGIVVDTLRNITKALEFNPFAIVVNMPSNDAGRGYGPATQMANFRKMDSTAQANGIELFVCTTQPRNFGNPTTIAIQTDTRDSIIAEFGARSIDFWTGFADSTDQLALAYDSGDGVHMNDAAHAILYQRVKDMEIPGLCISTATSLFQPLTTNSKPSIFPNPFENQLHIQLRAPMRGRLTARLFDLAGRELCTERWGYEASVDPIILDWEPQITARPQGGLMVMELILQTGQEFQTIYQLVRMH
ncbi:SGNH/GDSL hydrolase family protein [Pontibacter sp. G13]|uniref:SGNH/GDSL hydrolase family protein n=1 Tax=Pontibacter sp. G13 TaxID=3074898 RepID=UPI0028890594|nr:SGNH/GDSL hydrolase family protein [Pontibacter sp. G13]WNJ19156.1 SGNH/GDSL hydrolase family protein [Pontibacter sp. G13]